MTISTRPANLNPFSNYHSPSTIVGRYAIDIKAFVT